MYCLVLPASTDELAEVTAIESRVAAVTFRVAVSVFEVVGSVAVIVIFVCSAKPVAKPVLVPMLAFVG